MTARGAALSALWLLGCDASAPSRPADAATNADAAVEPAGEVCARYCGAFAMACGAEAAACEADCLARAARARGACAGAFAAYFGCAASMPGAFLCVGEGLATPGQRCEAPLEAWRSCL